MGRLPIKNHSKLSIAEKEEITPDIWPEISQDLSLWRRPACPTLSKSLDILSATPPVAPNLLKVLGILRDKLSKDLQLIEMIKNPFIYKFFKDFTNHRKKTNRAVVFSHRPFPNILNSSTSIYENSGLQFFRTSTGILWWIKVCYDLLNHLGSYLNTMQFQVSSWRENR